MKRALQILEVVVAIALLATIAHAWLPLSNPIGLWIQTGLSLAGWHAAEAMEHTPVFGSVTDAGVLLEGLVLAALVAGPTWALRESSPPWLRRLVLGWAHVGGLPALLGLVAVIAFGGGLSGGLALVPAAVVLGVALRQGEARAWTAAEAFPRGAFTAACLVGFPAFLMLHALYVSGPGIQPAPVADGLGVLDDLVAALPAGPAARGAARVGAVLGGIALAVIVVRRGVPLVPRLASGPAGWMPSLALFGAIGLVCAAPTQLLEVWRCPDVAGPLTQLRPEPGTFQLAAVGDRTWVNLREQRLSLVRGPDGWTEVDWTTIQRDAWPEELIPLPTGEVWVGLVAPDVGDTTLMATMNPDGSKAGEPWVVPDCYVASWTWLEERGQLVLGCEYQPEFLVVDPARRAVVRRIWIPRLGSVEEIVRDPGSGQVLAAPLWFGTWLSAIDLDKGHAVRSRFVGDFNWGAAEKDGVLWLTRFHEGRVVGVDLEDLSIVGTHEADWGARPAVVVDDWLIVAGTFSGRLRAIDLGGERDDRVLRVGGLVRSLAPSSDGRRLTYGGRCGIAEVDLDAWLRRPSRD